MIISESPLIIRLPWPPSVNHYWCLSRGGKFISKRGMNFRRDVVFSVGKRKPITTPIKMIIEAMMPDKRRRDLDNLLKAPLDALQHAGVYLDDNQIHNLHIIKVGVKSPGMLNIMIIEEPIVVCIK